MKHLVVIDTNVLISSLLSKHSDASTVKVMDAIFDSKIIPLYNEEILQEYTNVLHRPKFNFSNESINLLLGAIRSNGVLAERLDTGQILPDSKDLVFYEVCMAKRNNDSMLVTGNIKHFPAMDFIVTPNELVNLLNL